MKKLKDISILDYKYQKQSGYYYFDIKIVYEDSSTSNKPIAKRYSQIKELYKILLLKCPGCLIPKFKSKSFKMKLNLTELTKEQKSEIISRAQKFLQYIISHPILIKNKSVSEFFSLENKEINKNQTLKTNKMKTFMENEEKDDDEMKEDLSSSSSIDKISKSDNITNDNNNSKKEKEKNYDGFEIIEKEDYKDLFEDEEENDLINMFLEEENNKNKGIISKSKDVLLSAYKYIISYTEENNIEVENKPNEGMKLNLQEKDIEFIKSIYHELGEDIEINNYGKEIMKIKEGFEYIINNFQKESEIIGSKTKSLDNIIKYFKEVKNIDSKNNKKNKDQKNEDNNIDKDNDEFENIEKKENEDNIKEKRNKKENWDNLILEEDINKIEKYSSINKKFIEEELNVTLNIMNELKEIIDCLSDIFDRKKSHIFFLIKLQSQLNEKTKRHDLEEDENKKKLVKDINFFKKKIEKEKLFINKINENLKYEINKFKKEKENSIYFLINDLYKKNYLKQCEISDIFNKVISFDDDSENSSKIKGENEKSLADSDHVEDNNKKDKEENNNQDKSRKFSEDDF